MTRRLYHLYVSYTQVSTQREVWRRLYGPPSLAPFSYWSSTGGTRFFLLTQELLSNANEMHVASRSPSPWRPSPIGPVPAARGFFLLTQELWRSGPLIPHHIIVI